MAAPHDHIEVIVQRRATMADIEWCFGNVYDDRGEELGWWR